MFNVSESQFEMFRELAIKKFKEKVLIKIDHEYAYFPSLSLKRRRELISLYVDSALECNIKIEKAVFNYVVASWLYQDNIANIESVFNFLNSSPLNDIHKTEKIKRDATIHYFSLLNRELEYA